MSRQHRWAVAERGDDQTELHKLTGYLLRQLDIGWKTAHLVIPRDSRNLAVALIVRSQAVVVLLCGADTLQLFRPDLTLTQMVGRPFLINPGLGQPVVGIPTWHPKAAVKVPRLREQLEDNVRQAHWRGVFDPFGRWPDDCVKCGRDACHADDMGLYWCEDHFAGHEPPRHIAQMTLGGLP